MKIRYKFIALLCCTVISIHNVLAQSPEANDYQKTYMQLSSDQQKVYVENFAKKLSSDSNYVAMKLAMIKMKVYLQDFHKLPGDTTKRKKTKDEEITYYKERGMQNPEQYLNLRSSVPRQMLKVMLKFPEYGKLDKALIRQITQRADALIKQ